MSHAIERIVSAFRGLGRIAVLLAALAAGSVAHGEERRYYFDTHDSATNLAQHSVNAIFQDRAGYLWIATEGGVNAYDGYRYRLYEHHPDDPASLPDDFVTAVAEDDQRRIWLGSNGGSLAALDAESGKATTYALPADAPDRERRGRVGALAFDRQHTLWLGSAAGIERVDSQSGRRSVVFAFPDAAADGRVSALIVASDGTVWAATSSGVLRIAAASGQTAPVAATAIPSAYALAIGKGGALYAGAPGGLFRIDPASGNSERLWPAPAAVNSVGTVRQIAQDEQGRLWLAVDPGGLVVFDPATLQSELLEHDHDMPGSLPENSITALYADRSGLLWVGGATRGFSTVDPRGARFGYIADLDNESTVNSGNDIRAIFEDRQGYLWLGSKVTGLKRYDRAKRSFESFDALLARASTPPATGAFQVRDIRGTSDDTLWIATDRGVFALDAARHGVRQIPVDPGGAQGLPAAAVNVLLPARDGSLWFGSADAGLAHWWPNSSRWEFFRRDTPRGNVGLAHDEVLALLEDRDERIWIGTRGGLSVYDPRQQTIRSFRAQASEPHALSDDTVLALHQHSDGSLWIGTRSGLNRLDAGVTLDGRFLHYAARNGASGNAISGILEDRKGMLWLSTNRGISSFDHTAELFHNFSLKDGLQGFEFNPGAAAALADGRLAFGGGDGVNIFDPADIRFSRYPAPVVVTGLQVDGKVTPLPPASGDLHLAPSDRAVRFEFAALDYAAPDQNEFSYRLHGFDEGWIKAGNRHEATYANLPPGDYCLEVRGANHDGTWNEKTATVGLVVDPPWWGSRLMYALYGATGLLGLERLRYLYMHRRRKELAHNRALAERESRLRLALWGSGDEFWDWDLRRNEITMTGADELIAGATEPPQPANLWFNDHVHEDDRAVVAERLSDHLHGLRSQFESEHRISRGDGAWAWVFVRGKIVDRDEQGKPLRVSGTIRDVTVTRAAERERRIAAEVIDSMTEAVCVTDLEFRFVSANRAFTRMTGYEQAAVIGQSATLLNCSKHPPEHYRAMRETFVREGHWRGELWQRRKDGEEFLCWLEISAVLDAVGERTHFVGVMSDITDRKRAEQELRYLANYDTMTGLPNRALLSERLGQAIVRARHNGRNVALLFLDLDRFKHVNDSMGHAAGDRMLRAAGARLRACIAPTDTVARLGGDEFTVVLENIGGAQQAEEVAQRLLEAFVVPLHLDSGEDVVISPSIGISLFPEHGTDPGELLKSADTAMYQAKERGRNTYMFYTSEMDAHARSRATLIAALRRGLERNEFNVVYQPKLSLVENRVTGVEALLRWNTEEFGSVPPVTFIPLAEDTGLIVPIGEFVLDAACAQLRRWHDQGFPGLKVAVNLSMLQLLRAELPVRLRQILETHGLQPDQLELELTETMVMANAEQSVRTLSELKSIGVTLAIDDFGTGYSSLSYLKRLPIDTLKIDQAFVGDITTDPEDAAITTTIITLAHSLGLDVVAEGVETAEQLQYLRSQGCDEIQGHWFARPMEADACFAFLRLYEDNRLGRVVARGA